MKGCEAFVLFSLVFLGELACWRIRYPEFDGRIFALGIVMEAQALCVHTR